MALLLITHDLGVVADTCATTNVMYGGRDRRVGDDPRCSAGPAHPYTVALLRSIPNLDGEPQGAPGGDRRSASGAALGAGGLHVRPAVHRRSSGAARTPRSSVVDGGPSGTRVACWNPSSGPVSGMLEVEDLRVTFTLKGGWPPQREG